MRFWRSKKYIDTWYKLTPQQRKTLRLINRRKNFEWWQLKRDASRWAETKDYILASLLILIPVEGLMYLIYLIGRLING